MELGTLTVGKIHYDEVRVLSSDARSLFFTHSNGLASVRLRELPAEVQTRLGYDPLNPPPEPPSPVVPLRAASSVMPRSAMPDRAASSRRRLEQLLHVLGTPAQLAQHQSLREEFAQLDLLVKNQGRRPSCAVYAITSALEFQFFQLDGRSEPFSEEYLIWATRRCLGLAGEDGLPRRNAAGNFAEDVGYSIPSVVGALATYGVALQVEMPPVPAGATEALPVPAATLIERSRLRRGVLIMRLPGRDPKALLNNLVHVLNARLPAPVAIAWPATRRIPGGLLDRQPVQPDAFHAVTFLGYECPSGRLEDATFVFKNSYGATWGDEGYGHASWSYLSHFIKEVYVIDVRAADSRARF